MFLMRRYCFLGAFFEVARLDALTFHCSRRPFLTYLALPLLLILFVLLSSPAALLELCDLLHVLDQLLLLELVEPFLFLLDLGSQVGQLVMRLIPVCIQLHLQACGLGVLAALGQELPELLEAVAAERLPEVILNYGYFQLAGQPVLQVVEGGLVEPQQVLLFLSSPLCVLEDLVAADLVEPVQHPQVDHLRAAEVEHWLLQTPNAQVRQQLGEVGNVGRWVAAINGLRLGQVEELGGAVLRQRGQEAVDEVGVLDGSAGDFILGR